MDKGIIYYTDNTVEEPIFSLAQKFLLEAGLPIVSVSLKPVGFGENLVLLDEERSYPTMVKQIIMALKRSKATYVFFCENDVLYHKSHFDYLPPSDDVYYYNINNWRWGYKNDTAISYDGLTSLSSLCVNREFALEHYKMRAKKIKEMGWDKIRSREPRWARLMGYEPGTKKIRRGGFSDDKYMIRRSEFPNIDIRHSKTFSKPKITLDSFKHYPVNWQEKKIEDIEGWNLRHLFNLYPR